jgi:hypothetical protein
MEFKEAMALARTHARDAGGKRCQHEETELAPLVWDFEAADTMTGYKVGPVAKVALVLRPGVTPPVMPQLDVLAVGTMSRSEGMGVLATLSRAVVLMDRLEGLLKNRTWPQEEIATWMRTRVRGKVCAWDGLDLDPDI